MLHSKSLETIVGVFVAIGLGALLILAMKVSNLSSLGTAEGYQILAKFDNIGGLKVRSPVKMAGVRVGQVSDITFDDESYEAVAVLNIDKTFSKIPLDTTANIYTSGLLGEQYVALEAGGDMEYMKEGDSVEITQSAVVLEQVIGQFLYDKASGDDG